MLARNRPKNVGRAGVSALSRIAEQSGRAADRPRQTMQNGRFLAGYKTKDAFINVYLTGSFRLQYRKVQNSVKENYMGQASKNSRTSSTTQKFFCTCGGEIKMKTIFDKGKVKNLAECDKCKRQERRPSDFS